MFNYERELELRSGNYDVGRVVPYRGNLLQAELLSKGTSRVYDHVYFDAITGVYQGDFHNDNPERLRAKSATRPVKQFHLHAGQQSWAKDEWVKLPTVFTDGAVAADEMKTHNRKANESNSPFRFMLKSETILSPIREFPKWMEERFATKEYVPVCWADEPWAIKEHYARISHSDDSMVAFLPDTEAGENDKFSTMMPGRYLERYYSDVLTPTEIQEWAVKHDGFCELKFARTPDEIYEVYTSPRGPTSCMTSVDGDSYWNGRQNPIRVYGAGDLALAYIERRGRIIARALVWPERKIAGRHYGDIDRLREKLRAEGYTLDCSTHNVDSIGAGGFNGAKLLKIPLPEMGSRYVVMPYIDYGYSATEVDGEDYFVLSNDGSGFCCKNTGGHADMGEEAEGEDTFCCRRCDEEYPDSHANYVEGAGSYCNHCYENYTSCCDRCSSTVSDQDTTDVGNDTWCDTCVDRHATPCDYCHERAPNTEITVVQTVTGDTAGDACESCISDDEVLVWSDRRGAYIDTSTGEHCSTCNDYFEDTHEHSDETAPETETA